ncbi:hypothetical protein CR513_00300, partial [Mucuna pruriens]
MDCFATPMFGGLPKGKGVDTILVEQDAHFILLLHPYTFRDVATALNGKLLQEFPSSIVLDRDQIFISTFWQELFQSYGTKLKFSSGYHSQITNAYLRCLVNNHPCQWVLLTLRLLMLI